MLHNETQVAVYCDDPMIYTSETVKRAAAAFFCPTVAPGYVTALTRTPQPGNLVCGISFVWRHTIVHVD